MELRKENLGIDLLAHDLDVCVVVELILFYIIPVHECLDVHFRPQWSMSRKVRNRVIGDSFLYDVYHGV